MFLFSSEFKCSQTYFQISSTCQKIFSIWFLFQSVEFDPVVGVSTDEDDGIVPPMPEFPVAPTRADPQVKIFSSSLSANFYFTTFRASQEQNAGSSSRRSSGIILGYICTHRFAAGLCTAGWGEYVNEAHLHGRKF